MSTNTWLTTDDIDAHFQYLVGLEPGMDRESVLAACERFARTFGDAGNNTTSAAAHVERLRRATQYRGYCE